MNTLNASIKKTNSVILLIGLLFMVQSIQAQNTTKEYFVPSQKVQSSGSRIEVNSKGDTVLISYFLESNVRQYVQSQKEMVYKGTPFFKNGWYKSKIMLDANTKASTGVIGYDLVANRVFVTFNSNEPSVEIKPYEFEIEGHVFRKYRNQFVAAGEYYYEKLIEGEVELFKRFICVYHPAVTGDKTGYEQTGDGYEGEYIKKEEYYLISNGKMQKISKSFKVFDKNEKIAKDYAKQNNLKLEKPHDLILIVKYLNSIETKNPS